MSALAVLWTFHRVVDRLLQRPKTSYGMLLHKVHCTIQCPIGVPREDIFVYYTLPSATDEKTCIVFV